MEQAVKVKIKQIMKTTVIKDFNHSTLGHFDKVEFEFGLKENSSLFGNKISKITTIVYNTRKEFSQFEISEGIKEEIKEYKSVINISTSDKFEEVSFKGYPDYCYELDLSIKLQKGFNKLLIKSVENDGIKGEFIINKDGEYIKYENDSGYKLLPETRWFREDDTTISFPDSYEQYRMGEVYDTLNYLKHINGFFNNHHFIPNIKMY